MVKLYQEKDKFPQLVHLTARLMQIELRAQDVAADDKELRKKSITGRFPLLETPEGHRVCESLPIARYLAREHPSFNGATAEQKAEIDMWVDYIHSNVGPAARRVADQIFGNAPSDQRGFSIAVNELKSSLSNIESHLRLRNFLVGHQLTLADAVLVSTLSTCFELVFDKKVRKSNLPNTSRYTTLLLKTPPFVSSFGTVAFCQNAIMPQFTDGKGGK